MQNILSTNSPGLTVIRLISSCVNEPVIPGSFVMHYLNLSLTDIDGEIWKDVKDYEGIYQVSNFGRVKSLDRIDCKGQHRKEKIISQAFDEDGYLIGNLSKDRKRKSVRWHRVIYQSFHPIANLSLQINHKNGIKTDNAIENLEWCTNHENVLHAIQTNLRKPINGDKNTFAALSNSQVLEIFHSTKTDRQLSKDYNVGILCIRRIKNGMQWGSVTGKSYTPKAHNQNFTNDVALEIFNASGSNTEIAKQFNTERHTVANIKLGLTYSRITGKKHVVKHRKQI